MAVAEDLAAFYDVANGDAELVTVQGDEGVPALFDEATELVLGEQLVTAPTLRLPARPAAEDGAVVVRGVDYVIRQVRKLPPDGRELQLILARVSP